MTDIHVRDGLLLVEPTSSFPTNPIFAGPAAEIAVETGFTSYFLNETGVLSTRRTWRAIDQAAYRMGRLPIRAGVLNTEVLRIAREMAPTIVLAVGGQHLTRPTIEGLNRLGIRTVVYLTDDPFNPIVRVNRNLRWALPAYEMVFCTKLDVMADLRQLGCADVRFSQFGYSPSLHYPEEHGTLGLCEQYICDVSFVGGADADRVRFFRELIECKPSLDLRLYGGYWRNDDVLRQYSRGFVRGQHFRAVAAHSVVNINLIRRMNRDDHVMRTFELPACKGFMAVEPTETHCLLFTDGVSAVFFESATELADKLDTYLSDPARCRAIASGGWECIVRGSHTYRDRLTAILQAVDR